MLLHWKIIYLFFFACLFNIDKLQVLLNWRIIFLFDGSQWVLRVFCMSDHRNCEHPAGPMFNGILPSESPSFTTVLDVDRLSLAEERTAELIACIKPNTLSEERRNAVANYIQRLITNHYSCKVGCFFFFLLSFFCWLIWKISCVYFLDDGCIKYNNA